MFHATHNWLIIHATKQLIFIIFANKETTDFDHHTKKQLILIIPTQKHLVLIIPTKKQLIFIIITEKKGSFSNVFKRCMVVFCEFH